MQTHKEPVLARRAVYPMAALVGAAVLIPVALNAGSLTPGGGGPSGPYEVHLTVIEATATPGAGEIRQSGGDTLFITCPHDAQVLSGGYMLPAGTLDSVSGAKSPDGLRWTFTHSAPIAVGTVYTATCAP